jgi:hypothetical protein
MMTSIVIPILAVMALAVVHGMIKPRHGCGAKCATCNHACESAETDEHHVA